MGSSPYGQKPCQTRLRVLAANGNSGYNCVVKSAIHVASPPARPLVIYDGECAFCCFWIRRWQQVTGQQVDYVPFQGQGPATGFPDLTRQLLQTAVHLVETDGAVFSGAEAAFRALAHNPSEHWLLDWYEHSPTFARVTESAYRFIASHRGLFSALTRLAWGRHVEPSSYQLARWLFLRSLGLIYLIAFLSLWVQIVGLIGANGILPAKGSMEVMSRQAATQHIGAERYHVLPTFCWFDTSDRFLQGQCAAGTILAIALLIGFAPAPCLFLLWLLYLSLVTISSEFLGFQWDNLLLEVGFLAIFLAPLQWLPKLPRAPPPSRLVLWLFRWLLFRLMFESGCVKLLSGDPTWRNFSALTVHYETQPLPTWIAWYAHQLPQAAQKASTAIMFIIELFIPFLIFTPPRPRQFACAALVLLQVMISLTGNYCFFNLLAIALCLLLLDDSALMRLLPGNLRRNLTAHPQSSPTHSLKWPRQLTVPLFCVTLAMSLIQLVSTFHVRLPWPRPVVAVYKWVSPFRTINSYGLFAVMTTTRPEIIVQGSNDGTNWLDYEFKYKPGDVKQRPKFVEPHQPRLDWQMWFVALSNYQQNPWLMNFCVRLLQGKPEVLRLLKRNPFPAAPPRFIRAVLYEYHFTDFAARRHTGAWWRREFKGLYSPTFSLREESEKQPANETGPPL